MIGEDFEDNTSSEHSEIKEHILDGSQDLKSENVEQDVEQDVEQNVEDEMEDNQVDEEAEMGDNEVVEEYAMEDNEANKTQENQVEENGFNIMQTNETDLEEPPSKQQRIEATPKPMNNAKRLIISQMKLTNFKSYAGTQVIGPFHKSFSAVVGPNGSGKSNVIDSLLFVFGYRANKMRQGKLSELIHNSKQATNIENCSVEVYFVEIRDIGEDMEIIPNTELVIKRTAYKNNSSRYFINGRVSSYTEVTDLLRNKGIDLDHKRFLILQGEVESIAQMKPKALNEHDDGLLEYLEDIIGTSKYKEPIEHKSLELEKASETRQEKQNRMKIVEKEVLSLEGKKLEAEAYLKDENELVKKKSIIYQIKKLENTKAKESSKDKLEELKYQLSLEKEKNSETLKLNNQLEAEHKELNDKLKEINKVLVDVAKQHDKMASEDIKLQVNYKHIKGKKKKLKTKIESDEHKINQLKNQINNLLDDDAKTQNQIKELETNLEAEEAILNELIQGLKGKTEGFSNAIEEKQKELAPWNEKINQKQVEIDILTSKLNLLQSKKQAYEKQLDHFKNSVNELISDKELKQQEIKQLESKKDNLVEDIKLAEKELSDAKQLDQQLLNNYENALQRYNEAQSSIQTAKAKSKVYSAIMQQKELGIIHGIHGRLGDLGTIDEKYDVAISTACSQLENIIVDTIETAQKCIKFLRDNNVGRATFMALDRLPKNRMDKINTPENVPRLFDLVKPKDKIYFQAFYNTLRDTLVAKDLDQARKVGMGKVRYRVVTLSGEMVEKSGTMSGGGNRIQRGAMNSKFNDNEISPEQLEKLKLNYQEVQQEHQQFRSQLRQKELDLNRFKMELPQTDTNISKLKMDWDALENQIKDAKYRYAQLKGTAALSKQELEDMANNKLEINNLNKEKEKLELDSKNIRQEIERLEDKILKVGGVQLRAQNAKVSGIKEHIDQLEQKISNIQVTKNKTEKDIIKVQKESENDLNEIENLKKEQKEIADKLQQISSKSIELQDKIEEINNDKTEVETKIEQVNVKMEEISEDINLQKTKELEINNKIDDQKRHYKECLKREEHWNKELNSLTLQYIDDEDNDEDDMEEEEQQDQQQLIIYNEQELDQFELKELEISMNQLQNKLKNQTPNLGVLTEYRKKKKDFNKRKNDFENANEDRQKIKEQFEELRQTRHFKFMEGFSQISYKLKEMYQMITLGGNAELELVDNLDPFSEGIIFSVMPPKKSWKNISNLSGGEKTLSSLALVFALHHFKPTPLYVMDEIDAALDFRNVSIVANYIKERTKDAQFIIISLRNNMFEVADRLVGIYKTFDQTKSITIDPNAIALPN